MNTLLKRLPERAQSSAGGRLRPLATSLFTSATSATPDAIKRADIVPTEPDLPVQEQTPTLMAKKAPMSATNAENNQSRPSPLVDTGSYTADSAPPVSRHGARPRPSPASDIHASTPLVQRSDEQPQSLMPARQHTGHDILARVQAPHLLDEAAPHRWGEQEPRAGRMGMDGAEPKARSLAKAEATEVHIHIGRIEVRSASTSAAVQRPAAPRPSAPSLDDYLARRGGSR